MCQKIKYKIPQTANKEVGWDVSEVYSFFILNIISLALKDLGLSKRSNALKLNMQITT